MPESILWSGNSAPLRVAVYAVIMEQGQVLLAHRNDIDWWNLPGGGMETGETVEEAIQREVREETGLEIEVEKLIGVYSKPQKDEIVLTLRCHVIGGTLSATLESRECRYFAPDAMPINTLPKHRQRVEDALLNLPYAVLRDQRTPSEEDQRLPAS
jgi:8-oxo-dGTP diphosphatase